MTTKKIGVLVYAILLSTTTFAQQQGVEMADAMRSNGKIYNVVAVCLVILLGLIVYLFSVDRKITRLERNNRLK